MYYEETNKLSKLFVAFMILYPFLVVPFFTLTYTTLIKLVYLLSFIMVVWIILSVKVLFKRIQFNFRTVGEQLALLFLCLVSLATIFSVDPMTSFLGSINKFHGFLSWFSYISIFFFSYHFVKIHNQIKVLRLLIFSSLILCVYGIYQHFFVSQLVEGPVKDNFSPSWLFLDNVNRVKSWAFFDNPNHFGSYLIILLLIGMVFYLINHQRMGFIIYGFSNVLIFATLLYTGSRAAWLSIFFAVIIFSFLIFLYRRDLTKKLFSLLFMFFIVLLVVNFTEDHFVIKQTFSIGGDVNAIVSDKEDDRAGSGRWGTWKRAIPILKEYYLIGSGPSTFNIVYRESTEDGFLVNYLDNAHNDYLEIAITIGIPALLIYLAFIFTIIKSGVGSIKRLHGDQQLIGFAYIAIIIGYLIKVMFNISVIPVAPFFFMILGFSYVLFRKVDYAHDNQKWD